MDPLYTLAMIHPRFSRIWDIESEDAIARLLATSIIDLVSITIYPKDKYSGACVTVIESRDPASPDGLARYRVEGASLRQAMAALRDHAPQVYKTLMME